MKKLSDFIVQQVSIDDVHYQKFMLDDKLKDIVAYCWLIEHRSDQFQRIPDIHIPDGNMEVIFVFEGAYGKWSVDQKISSTITQSCVIGMQTKTHLVKCLGKLRMMGIKFTPLGFSLMFGDRVYASRDRHNGFDHFKVDWLDALHEKLFRKMELKDIINSLSDTLLKQVNPYRLQDGLQLANSCLQMILHRKGDITVNEVAERHHKSMRQVQRYFRQYFDASPKQIVNLVRFRQFYQDSVLRKLPPTAYLDYGYFDQAHFIKDFQRRTGITPTQALDRDFLEKNKIAQVNLV